MVPRSFKMAMNRRSESSSKVVTDMGMIESILWLRLREDMAVSRNSVRFKREEEVADRQLEVAVARGVGVLTLLKFSSCLIR
jgi:hypothetical protein